MITFPSFKMSRKSTTLSKKPLTPAAPRDARARTRARGSQSVRLHPAGARVPQRGPKRAKTTPRPENVRLDRVLAELPELWIQKGLRLHTCRAGEGAERPPKRRLIRPGPPRPAPPSRPAPGNKSCMRRGKMGMSCNKYRASTLAVRFFPGPKHLILRSDLWQVEVTQGPAKDHVLVVVWLLALQRPRLTSLRTACCPPLSCELSEALPDEARISLLASPSRSASASTAAPPCRLPCHCAGLH